MPEELEDVPYETDFKGPYGILEFVPFKPTKPKDQASVCSYLITSSVWHPVWGQYFLSVVSLNEFEGLPSATLQFPGATHELLLLAINPDHHQTKETMLRHADEGTLPFLKPVNIAHQFEATDEEMKKVAWLCGRAVVCGVLNPETGDAPTTVRENWLSACVKTLAHIRGEVHSSH